MLRKLTSLAVALLLGGSAFAQDVDARTLYFMIGEDRVVADDEEVTLCKDLEWYQRGWTNGFLCDDIFVCVDEAIKGKVEVTVQSLDEQHCVFGGFGDDTYPQCWGYCEWKASKEYRMVSGEKAQMEVFTPVLNDDGTYSYGGRVKVTLARPECEEGCYPVVYIPVTSFVLEMSNNPGGTSGVGNVLAAGAGAVAGVFGSELRYSCPSATELTICSAAGNLEYMTGVSGEGSLSLDFLPAGLHVYRLGDTTGKILVK